MAVLVYRDTPFQDFYQLLVQADACQEALDWCYRPAFRDQPFEDVFTQAWIRDPALDGVREEWAWWILKYYRQYLSRWVRAAFFTQLNDLQCAWTLWRIYRMEDAEFGGKTLYKSEVAYLLDRVRNSEERPRRLDFDSISEDEGLEDPTDQD